MIKQGIQIPNYKAILEYCLELHDSVELDEIFKNSIAHHISFDKNQIFKDRTSMTINELKRLLGTQGYQVQQ
jgi:hypothetical protein